MATLPNPLPRLATDPSGRSLGLQLPPGTLVDATDDGSWHEPLLWYAGRAASPGNWAALGATAARAGLLPVLVDVAGSGGGPEQWDLMPARMSYPGDHDAEEVLADLWESYAEDAPDPGEDHPGKDGAVELLGEPEPYDEVVAPFGAAWPGLAPAGVLAAAPEVRAAEAADSLTGGSRDWFKEPRLALVPARRSADIPAAVGWTGPVDHESDVAVLCSVLRSWEDRFGIRVVALGFDALVVSVAAPPTTLAEAQRIAAEHFVFCPDNVSQGEHRTLRGYAEGLVGETVWSFRWD
ncbi:DUF4253 domain-containing protein [Streptomyces sp. NPDC003697]